MTARSSYGWRSTMSISSSPSRYCAIVEPERIVCAARATVCDETPSARALSWSSVSFRPLTFSFQLSLTPIVFGLARRISFAASAIRRTVAGSSPSTRNCTG
jgi:hypothetical protein